MTGEITRKSVLLECLEIMKAELAICSKHYNGLEPMKGMEEAWQQGRKKVEILKDLIHAYDSEPVRAALADWQKDVMENGPRALEVTADGEDQRRYVRENMRFNDDALMTNPINGPLGGRYEG